MQRRWGTSWTHTWVQVAGLGQAQGNITGVAKAQEEEKGRGRASGLGPGLSRAVLGLHAEAPLPSGPPPSRCSPPIASLVLLNQQPQDFRLRQGYVGVHTEVVSAATVLSAQVPAGRGTRGRPPPLGSQSYSEAVFSTPTHVCDHRAPAKGQPARMLAPTA